MRTHEHAHTCTCMNTYVHIRVHTCKCTYACMHTYTLCNISTFIRISIKCRLATHHKCTANDTIAKLSDHGDDVYMSHLSSKPNGTYKERQAWGAESTHRRAVRLSAANIRTYIRIYVYTYVTCIHIGSQAHRLTDVGVCHQGISSCSLAWLASRDRLPE